MKKLEVTDEELGFLYAQVRPRYYHRGRRRELNESEKVAIRISKNLRAKIVHLMPEGATATLDAIFASFD